MPTIMTTRGCLQATDIVDRIRVHLENEFGEESVFDLNEDKDQFARIVEAASPSTVLLVVVGPNWISSATEGAQPVDGETDQIGI